MRVRTYGLLLLAFVGVAPIVAFGWFAIERSERTTMEETRGGNQRLATTVAERIGAYVDSERTLLHSAGTAAVQTREPRAAASMLEAFGLNHRHLRGLTVYREASAVWATQFDDTDRAAYAPLIATALAGTPARSPVRVADKNSSGAFAHTMILAEPIVVAGKDEGAIVASVDLVGLWPPINAIRVGRTGFVRLLTTDGELLAHGDPEERRFVFDSSREKNVELMARARRGDIAINERGDRVLASLAPVKDSRWVVVVEQSEAEAFSAAAVMRRDLLVLVAAVLVAVVVLGLLFGRIMVRGLERLRAHTRVLAAGDLDATVELDTRLVEVRALAGSLNDMSASLKTLHEEAKARERITTFGRIAAGLAHDLRQPIETLRTACDAVVANPDDPAARELLAKVNERDLPRLKEYVADLRQLARGGQLTEQATPTDTGAMVREMAAEMSAHPKWQGVDFRATGEVEPIVVNASLLRRALFNLASNAADACTEKGPGQSVTIEVTEVAPNGEIARNGILAIEVADTGVGISAERLPELLSGDFASTKRSTGIGLGLGVARQVVEAHGGLIDVSSELGRGTTFTVTLPRSRPTG